MGVFNKDNKTYLNGGAKLFLDESLGLTDTINVRYPELVDLYQEQFSNLWQEFDVDIQQDRMDMLEVPQCTVDLMVKTISFQHLADSVSNRAISTILGKYVTNSELELMFNIQQFFEGIHAKTYSHIVKNCFADPNQALKETYEDIEVNKRAGAIIKAFDAVNSITDETSEADKLDTIILSMVALYALEGISFISSFAITFGIAENIKKFQGISQDVKLICRDELLHTRMDHAVLNILYNKEGLADTFHRLMPQIKLLIDNVVDDENHWTDYLFSDGRGCVGLSAELIKQEVKYLSLPLYQTFNLEPDFEVPEIEPCAFMKNYTDGTRSQQAAQEINLSSYQVNNIIDDTMILTGEDFL